MKKLNEVKYDQPIKGFTLFSGDPVTVIGEQVVELDDGRILVQFIYNIDGYTPENGKPFVGLKSNIVVD